MVGENEYCDITITDELSAEEVKNRLEKALPKDIEIKKVYEPSVKIGKVSSAKYELVFENTDIIVDHHFKHEEAV